jgi:hypothetical protein
MKKLPLAALLVASSFVTANAHAIIDCGLSIDVAQAPTPGQVTISRVTFNYGFNGGGYSPNVTLPVSEARRFVKNEVYGMCNVCQGVRITTQPYALLEGGNSRDQLCFNPAFPHLPANAALTTIESFR